MLLTKWSPSSFANTITWQKIVDVEVSEEDAVENVGVAVAMDLKKRLDGLM